MWIKIERLQNVKLAASDETQDFAIILKGGLLAANAFFMTIVQTCSGFGILSQIQRVNTRRMS